MLNYTTYRHDTSEKWVTFIHGAGGSSSIWFKQLRAFKGQFNILLVDLRGHGGSKHSFKDVYDEKYTFNFLTEDIVQVLEHEKVIKSHFIGISLGTILIRNLAENYPEKVESMVLGGAILKLNFRSQLLMRLGVVFKSIVPYLWLYKFFAFVIMPNKNHKESRLLFVREAKKLYQKEFIRWFKLTADINPLLRFFRTKDIKIPVLYIMGEEDYMFLPSIRKVVQQQASSELIVVKDCGHVVNVEQPDVFNQKVIRYIASF
ncbi:alpha/beta hydrolase [Cellulophaga sp. F20128]|uniref:alpha/beta fold hydrolase n=1 Tax=Cellulophaga sp. F20128 TaxID=2926413 RepID=UPI001FF10F6F|nr:alpha/beta hydrolase [Cellulophaga sp. F20128]MCK0158525.1 alpha/beta hydrolase [Cellulophaga sp. F20128]